MSVLVVSEECDPTSDAVVQALQQRNTEVHRVDLSWFPMRLDLDAALGTEGWVGTLRTRDREIALEELSSVFYRSPTAFQFAPGLSDAELRHARMEAKIGLGGCLSALPVLWANHPARQADMLKPTQLAVAQAVGLTVPRSAVTNRADAVRRFAREIGGPVVIKPLGYASILESGDRRALYTHVLSDTDLADLRGIEATAHLAQRYVNAKAYELRLTVVGSGGDFRFFPVAIHAGSPASKVDFRADYESLTYSIADIPGEVASGVQEFMRTFGISLAHFDFCVDDSGCHWFLECNGSGGQYQFAEKATGLPITDAIADLLRKGIS
jgi:hypothetical protein